jgi:hypothetical protein
VTKRLGSTRITRARARWYLLRFGGPLALLPSLLQPAAVVVTGIVIAVLLHHPAPLIGVLLVLAIVAFRLRRRTYDADARTEPEVVALVRDVAARTGAPPPDRIRIDAQPNAAFFRSPSRRDASYASGCPSSRSSIGPPSKPWWPTNWPTGPNSSCAASRSAVTAWPNGWCRPDVWWRPP